MTSKEFETWLEFDRIEPDDSWAQNSRLTAAVINGWAKQKIKPEKLMPNRKYLEESRQSPEAMAAQLDSFCKAHKANGFPG